MKAFIFDTETTGLIENRTLKLDKQPEIIEFYGCWLDLESGEGEISDEIEMLIKPSKPIEDPIITKITGLTNDHLADCQGFKHHAPGIKSAIESSEVVIAHNLSFDKEMVDIEFERLGQKVAWPRGICTVEATIHIKRHRLNLTALHDWCFGEGFPAAHRARNDVKALARCCVKLYEDGLL